MALSEDVREVEADDGITVLDEPDRPDGVAAGVGSGDLGTQMRVRKRDGSLEPVDLNKIVRAVARCAVDLDNVDSMRVATRTISGLVDGATTEELDELSIRTAAALIAEEPNYSRLAARLLATVIDKEVQNQDVYSFSQSVALGHEQGIISDETAAIVATNARKLNDAILAERNWRYEFFGLRTVYDRYLLRHPERRKVIETPQYFLMRVACGLATSPEEAIEFYELISSLDYLPSSPTLFNSGTTHPQMSSCYLLDSPEDNLDAIYDRYRDVARLSKHAGGIGLSYSRVRCARLADPGHQRPLQRHRAVAQDARLARSPRSTRAAGARARPASTSSRGTPTSRSSSSCATTPATAPAAPTTSTSPTGCRTCSWSGSSRTGSGRCSTRRRCPHLVDLYGDEFRRRYLAGGDGGPLRDAGLGPHALQPDDAHSRADRQRLDDLQGPSNEKCNQTGTTSADGTPNVVHLSNLCTEILEVTNQSETAVCNLGSVNLGAMVRPDADGVQRFDFDRLAEVVRLAVPFLDRVIDINFYPTDAAGNSNSKWRPVGLGLMGLQDVFFKLRLPFDSPEARELSTRISEEIYFHALVASSELAEGERRRTRLRRDPRRAGRAAVRPVGGLAVGHGPLG